MSIYHKSNIDLFSTYYNVTPKFKKIYGTALLIPKLTTVKNKKSITNPQTQ